MRGDVCQLHSHPQHGTNQNTDVDSYVTARLSNAIIVSNNTIGSESTRLRGPVWFRGSRSLTNSAIEGAITQLRRYTFPFKLTLVFSSPSSNKFSGTWVLFTLAILSRIFLASPNLPFEMSQRGDSGNQLKMK